MPIVASVIAKALAFADYFLGLFATVTVDTTSFVGACANLPVYNATITPCGASIATALAGLAEIGLQALGALLGGLLAT